MKPKPVRINDARVEKVEGSIWSIRWRKSQHRRRETQGKGAYLVKVVELNRLGAITLQKLLGEFLKTGKLSLGLSHDVLESAPLGGLGGLVEQV